MARLILAVFAVAGVPCNGFFAVAQAQTRQTQPDAADWPMYNRDLGGTRFSPLAPDRRIERRHVEAGVVL